MHSMFVLDSNLFHDHRAQILMIEPGPKGSSIAVANLPFITSYADRELIVRCSSSNFYRRFVASQEAADKNR